MISPVRQEWFLLIWSAIISILGAIFFIMVGIIVGMKFQDTLIILIIVPGIIFYGWLLSKSYERYIFNHKVNKPVDLKELVVGQTYYLNGVTNAEYKGQNEYTGKYGFGIYGVNDLKNPGDITYLLPGNVVNYISAEKEE